MEIKSVKIQGEGYHLNNEMSVPKADGNREYELIKEWLKDNTPEPEFTEEELAQQAKEQAKADKELALSTLTVTTASGKVFDGDETARIDMLTAINMANVVGQTSTMWKLANNTIVEVTLAELQEALLLALTRKGEIIGAINVQP